jgi:redox-sensitive bicupin YhaK (pirin superfamily)
MGFRSLRVINDDWVAPGRGFGAHAHRDMEILSYVLEGKLAHKDSMGHVEMLGPNEIQKMSAGNGVIHSEFNGSESEPVHFLQIWIETNSKGTAPAYEQIAFQPEEKRNRLKILASSAPVEGAVQIQQDAEMAVAELTPNSRVTHIHYVASSRTRNAPSAALTVDRLARDAPAHSAAARTEARLVRDRRVGEFAEAPTAPYRHHREPQEQESACARFPRQGAA